MWQILNDESSKAIEFVQFVFTFFRPDHNSVLHVYNIFAESEAVYIHYFHVFVSFVNHILFFKQVTAPIDAWFLAVCMIISKREELAPMPF